MQGFSFNFSWFYCLLLLLFVIITQTIDHKILKQYQYKNGGKQEILNLRY